jgi:hypothetical protein
MKIIKNKVKDTNTSLGQGFSDDQQMLINNVCVILNAESYNGPPKTIYNFGSAISNSAMQVLVSRSSSMSLEASSFVPGSIGYYFQKAQGDAFSSSVAFYAQVALPTLNFIPSYGVHALNNFGLAAYNKSPEYFREVCGNKFVISEHFGLNLFATLKINFDSPSYKSDFAAYSANYSFASIDESLNFVINFSKSYNVSGNLNILAFQQGGNSSALVNIFENSNNNIYTVNCPLNNVTKCISTAANLLEYESSNFPNQVGFNGDITGAPAVIHYNYLNYEDIGLNKTQTIITPEIQQARSDLSNFLSNATNSISNVSKFMNLPIVLNNNVNAWTYWNPANISANTKQDFAEIINNSKYNMDILFNQEKGGDSCYTMPKNCTNVRDDIQNQLIELPLANIMNKFKVAYLYKGSDSISIYSPLGNNLYSSAINYCNNGQYTAINVNYSNTYNYCTPVIIPLSVGGNSYSYFINITSDEAEGIAVVETYFENNVTCKSLGFAPINNNNFYQFEQNIICKNLIANIYQNPITTIMAQCNLEVSITSPQINGVGTCGEKPCIQSTSSCPPEFQAHLLYNTDNIGGELLKIANPSFEAEYFI